MSIARTLMGKVHGGESTRPSLDTMLERFDRELGNFNALVQPAPESKPRTPFDSPHLPVEKMSIANMSRRQFLAVFLPIMLPLLVQMRRSSKLYDGKFQPTRSKATP